MARIFVSHSSDDHYFVSLLIKLMEFHYVDVWCSLSDIEPGSQFPAQIDQAVKDANILVVVTSENTARSKWVTKEVSVFQTQNNKGLIVPLLLTKTDLDSIAPGLDQYHAIDFTKSMLDGFETLFKLLGKDFLTYENRRQSPTRRRMADRRDRDRRVDDLKQRIRRGFWKMYYQETKKDEFDEIKDTLREKLNMIEALQSEAYKYKYFDDTHQECEPDHVLDLATHRIWNDLKNKRTFKPVYLVEGIAEYLYENYQVEVKSDRRQTSRRTEDNRRRRRSSSS